MRQQYAARAPSPNVRVSVLIIDNDGESIECLVSALKPLGFDVVTVGSGEMGIEIAKSSDFAVTVIDAILPDMSGIDVARRIRAEVGSMPFVLIGTCLSTKVTVDAMRSGAIDVLDKPVAADDLIATMCNILDRSQPRLLPHREPGTVSVRAAGSIRSTSAERWARYVLKACESDADLRTLRDWARCIGVSYSRLRESCLLVGIRPHDARDFTRICRAVIHASAYRCRPEIFLDVGDRRTLAALMHNAGSGNGSSIAAISLEQFFRSQMFVTRDNDGLRELQRLLLSQQESGRVRAV
jgi:DNA-binding response OmpR family regulator